MSGQPSFHLRESAVMSVRFPPHPVLSPTGEADIMKDLSRWLYGLNIFSQLILMLEN